MGKLSTAFRKVTLPTVRSSLRLRGSMGSCQGQNRAPTCCLTLCETPDSPGAHLYKLLPNQQVALLCSCGPAQQVEHSSHLGLNIRSEHVTTLDSVLHKACCPPLRAMLDKACKI